MKGLSLNLINSLNIPSYDGHGEIVHSGQPAWLEEGFLVSSGEYYDKWLLEANPRVLASKNLISCGQNALVTCFPHCCERNQRSQTPLNVINNLCISPKPKNKQNSLRFLQYLILSQPNSNTT